MSFIAREIERIHAAILSGSNHRKELYAAQQALEWALEPDGIRSPYRMITGIPEGPEGCPSGLNPASS
jgi:hypothetical protein